MNRILWALAIGATTLAGCATAPAPGPAVTAPIPMSEKVLGRYQVWLNTPYPAYFALSRDGQYNGFSYCKYHPECGVTAEDALNYCRYTAPSDSGGCVIYAVDGKPVVNDPALAALTKSAK